MLAKAFLHIGAPALEDDVHAEPPSAWSPIAAPARPTWSSSPHPPAEGLAAACCHYCPSPCPGNIGSPGGAGLTSKPHRDQSTRSRLTWAVSPAAGIGLPGRVTRASRAAQPGATTD